MTMNMVNIFEAKAKLSELIEAAARGEPVVICNRNVPVAELRATENSRTEPRDLAPMFPDWTIADAFFDPLDDDEMGLWEGESESPRASIVAEQRSSYGRPGRSRKRK